MEHILVIDDEEDLVWSIKKSLCLHGYTVSCTHNGLDALRQIQNQLPDLIILDIIMPGMDGVEVCHHIRNNVKQNSIPIIFLTAHSELRTKIAAYTVGADDYLSKPFDMHELIMRIRAVLRRSKYQSEEESRTSPQCHQLQVGQLHLDLDTATVEIEKTKRVRLTPSELELLKFLMQHTGQIFSSEHLLRKVWKYPTDAGDPASVRWHIKNLRRKIELCPDHPVYLRTIPHYGYTLTGDRNLI
jgi:DNA-binding response OmpR family regulator